MSTRSQSIPLPAQISATRGDPEHTHMPAKGRVASESTALKVGAS
jgi:hypothetical protein